MKSIVVLGRRFKIKLVDQVVMIKEVGHPCHGLFLPDKATILLDKSMPENMLWLTLFHELQHAAHSVTGHNQVIEPLMQELLCETSAALIEDIFKALKVSLPALAPRNTSGKEVYEKSDEKCIE